MIQHNSYLKYIILAILCCSLATGCVSPTTTISSTTTSQHLATSTNMLRPSATVTVTATQLPTSTSTVTQTPANTPTAQKTSITPTETEATSSAFVNVPILLYHHINGETSTTRYQVSIPDFQSQMETLHEMGYQTISLSQFMDALIFGSTLPEKTVLITFDDGHQDVYENAFPIMNALGYSGILYIVANRIYDSADFLNIETLKEMINAGWEIGSHGYTHSDLTQDHQLAYQEIAKSKIDLENALQVEVESFAYPFGAFDTYLGLKVQQYGYQAAMGLGTSQHHTLDTLFYLNRIEIYNDLSIENFKKIFIGN